ncbi:MAG: hypothetical protein QG591_1510 [Planctomycetota bacterium]|nr:hypothetical protein [Planctomycetota bacterium]
MGKLGNWGRVPSFIANEQETINQPFKYAGQAGVMIEPNEGHDRRFGQPGYSYGRGQHTGVLNTRPDISSTAISHILHIGVRRQEAAWRAIARRRF